MNPSELFDPQVSTRVALSLLHTLWQGAVIFAVVISVGAICGRAAVSFRYWMNCAALIVLAACVPLNFFALVDVAPPAGRLFISPVEKDIPQPTFPAQSVPVIFPVASAPAVEPVQQPPLLENSHVSDDIPPAAPAAEKVNVLSGNETSFDWKKLTPWIVGAYSLGVCIMLLRLLAAQYGSQQLRRVAQPPVDSRITTALANCLRRTGLKIQPMVAHCARVVSPVLVGVFKPVILLPVAFASELTVEQVESILLHELAHLRRYDHIANFIQRLLEAFLFYHPAAWYFTRQISTKREHCCDDLVLRWGSDPCSYAEAIVRMSELRNRSRALTARHTAALAAAGDASPGSLRSRVLRILGEPEASPRIGFTRRGVLSCLCMLFVVGVLMSFSRDGSAQRGPQDPVVNPELDKRLRGDPAAENPPATPAENPRGAQVGSGTERFSEVAPSSQQLILSPLIEVPLAQSPRVPQGLLLNLDTGGIIQERDQADLTSDLGESDSRVRHGMNLVVAPATEEHWKAPTPNLITAALQGQAPQASVRLGGPEGQRIYFFKTKSGGMGILRLDPMERNSQTVWVRYRLLVKPLPLEAFPPVGTTLIRSLGLSRGIQDSCLDLDTGELKADEDSMRGMLTPPLILAGVDLFHSGLQSNLRQRTGLNLKVLAVDPTDWDRPLEDLQKLAQGLANVNSTPREQFLGPGPKTYLYETRERSVGILQFLTNVDEAGGEENDPNVVHIRMKLLSSPAFLLPMSTIPRAANPPLIPFEEGDTAAPNPFGKPKIRTLGLGGNDLDAQLDLDTGNLTWVPENVQGAGVAPQIESGIDLIHSRRQTNSDQLTALGLRVFPQEARMWEWSNKDILANDKTRRLMFENQPEQQLLGPAPNCYLYMTRSGTTGLLLFLPDSDEDPELNNPQSVRVQVRIVQSGLQQGLPPLKPGQELVRVLGLEGSELDSQLSLDSGALLSVPGTAQGANISRLASSGVDLLHRLNINKLGQCVGLDLKVLPVLPEDWDRSPEELQRLAQGVANVNRTQGEQNLGPAPSTYIYETRNGSVGILQFLPAAAKTGGSKTDPNVVRIRMKLLRARPPLPPAGFLPPALNPSNVFPREPQPLDPAAQLHWGPPTFNAAVRLRETLRQPISLHLNNQPLFTVLRQIADTRAINVRIDTTALAAVGVAENTPVTVNVDDVPLDRVLKLLLGPLGLRHEIDQEALNITSNVPQISDISKMPPMLQPVVEREVGFRGDSIGNCLSLDTGNLLFEDLYQREFNPQLHDTSGSTKSNIINWGSSGEVQLSGFNIAFAPLERGEQSSVNDVAGALARISEPNTTDLVQLPPPGKWHAFRTRGSTSGMLQWESAPSGISKSGRIIVKYRLAFNLQNVSPWPDVPQQLLPFLGPVQERDISTRADQFFDLDKGEYVNAAPSGDVGMGMFESVTTHRRAFGMQRILALTPAPTFLAGEDLKLMLHSIMAKARVPAADQKAGVVLKPDITYAFQTAEGAYGVLKLVSKNSPNGEMTIRYSLIKNGENLGDLPPVEGPALGLVNMLNFPPRSDQSFDFESMNFVNAHPPGDLGMSTAENISTFRRGYDMRVVSVPARLWETATEWDVKRELEHGQPLANTPIGIPLGRGDQTWVFRTREGTVGMMQLVPAGSELGKQLRGELLARTLSPGRQKNDEEGDQLLKPAAAGDVILRYKLVRAPQPIPQATSGIDEIPGVILLSQIPFLSGLTASMTIDELIERARLAGHWFHWSGGRSGDPVSKISVLTGDGQALLAIFTNSKLDSLQRVRAVAVDFLPPTEGSAESTHSLWLDSLPVTRDELLEKLVRLLQFNPGLQVHIRAQPGVDERPIVELNGALHGAGIQELSWSGFHRLIWVHSSEGVPVGAIQARIAQRDVSQLAGEDDSHKATLSRLWPNGHLQLIGHLVVGRELFEFRNLPAGEYMLDLRKTEPWADAPILEQKKILISANQVSPVRFDGKDHGPRQLFNQ